MFWKRRKKVKATELSSETFDQVIAREKNVMVFFEAPWCGACKMLHPFLNDLADENREEDIVIAVVNTDHERDLSQKYNVRSLPTLVIFKNGELLKQGPGMMSKPRLQEIIDSLIK